MIAILMLTMMPMTALAGLAEPVGYVLEAEKSSVGFTYRMNGGPMKGVMPVKRADIALDFSDIARSRIDVVLDVRHARAGVIFATEAMRGPSVLDVAHHPEILFRSTRITREGKGARIEGMVSIRGVTRPLVLQARLYRQKGMAKGDLSHLTVYLTGTIDRRQFKATGYPDIVGPGVDLRILARIRKR